jgi:hypothetical protein
VFMSPKLVGCYEIKNSNLVKPDLNLVIGTRRKAGPNKPKNYLLIKSGNRFTYLSGMFPFTNDLEPKEGVFWYSLDYEGVNYILCLKRAENQAQITRIDSPDKFHKSYNIVELGAKITPKSPENAGI